MRTFNHSVIVVFIVLAFCACRPYHEPPQTFTVMGTVCTVNLFEEGTRQRYSQIKKLLVMMENLFSANSETSELAAINRNAGTSPVETNRMLIDVTRTALAVAHETEYAFNPAIGPLVKLWNIGFDNATLPAADDITEALKNIDAAAVFLDEQQQTIYLGKKNMALDLGGITKGAAADYIAKYLTEEHIKKAVIDLGGNILLFGQKAPETPWAVGIKNPLQAESAPVIRLELPSVSIVTSGIYERFFVAADGTSYHHLLDPATGYPVDNNLMSVTIITERSIDADGLSTAAFVMGLEKGLSFVESRANTDAIFITKDKKIYATAHICPFLQVLNGDYTLVSGSGL